MRLPLFAAVAAMVVVAAMPARSAQVAVAITIPVAAGTSVESVAAGYDCGDRSVAATYINAGQVSLAVLDIDGETVVAANVISASGVRYAAGRYVWWTKGEEADLYDLMDGGEDIPAAHCTATQ